MPYVISDSFKQYLRDTTSPLVLVGYFYNDDKLDSVYHYSVFPFELDFFLSNFKVSDSYSDVQFYALIPPETGNVFLTFHVVTLYA